MPGCAHCGRSLDIIANQVGRRDTCPGCGEDLRSCRNCRHFDPTVAKACKEPFAEVPKDKDEANFCELFQLGQGGLHAKESRDALLNAAESLFKKK
ncbi:hypothetical protein DRW03_18905 [Corallococcus sp. H22C18031201]|uniref:hypothetical protein n=1 Tax=Citreicoccus inhibens TaxID=2849499 RepID=UPI000E762AFF|nr:hypothetical protein [Citreicoccus inhibens]MBU8896852.1 hypothetical protein [Citreicoccus inhibens]RJS20750.1 hypothetical protein DRW03_18905 [Corallococcus sp. H22C18031201]